MANWTFQFSWISMGFLWKIVKIEIRNLPHVGITRVWPKFAENLSVIYIFIKQMQLDYILNIKNFPYCNSIRVNTRLVPRLAVVWCKKLDMWPGIPRVPGQIPYGVYAVGKSGACPYGARTGLSRGCLCPDWPRCARGAPYQSRTGSGRERYLGTDY